MKNRNRTDTMIIRWHKREHPNMLKYTHVLFVIKDSVRYIMKGRSKDEAARLYISSTILYKRYKCLVGKALADKMSRHHIQSRVNDQMIDKFKARWQKIICISVDPLYAEARNAFCKLIAMILLEEGSLYVRKSFYKEFTNNLEILNRYFRVEKKCGKEAERMLYMSEC